ncbi:MAG: M23 family metallopeptidase, partial [Thermicanus sp.]|nr:M23 family metallopeptidase [Thermicanus sp.]
MNGKILRRTEKTITILLIGSLLVLISGCGEEAGNSVSPPQVETPPTSDLPTTPEEIIFHFHQNDFAYIYEHATKSFQQQLPYQSLVELGKAFNEGVKEYQLETKFKTKDGWKYIWIDESKRKSVTAVLNEKNRLTALLITPLETYSANDGIYSKTIFSFPFEGVWFVLWGGTDEVVNYHYKSEQERYAVDFVKMEEGVEFEGTGATNEEYYCYGEPVYAPAEGSVVAVEEDVEENQPGIPNLDNPFGNYVILKHGSGEYSLLSQLQKGSVTVEIGDKVSRGDLLGYVGNSGDSMEPHLHFQVMDSPHLEEMKSINIRFQGFNQLVQGM